MKLIKLFALIGLLGVIVIPTPQDGIIRPLCMHPGCVIW